MLAVHDPGRRNDELNTLTMPVDSSTYAVPGLVYNTPVSNSGQV